jgi:hypothetical protein
MLVLNPGDKLQGCASRASIVTYLIFGAVIRSSGTTYKRLGEGFLPEENPDPGVIDPGDLYTAPDDVVSVLIYLVIAVNTDSVTSRRTELYLLPKDGWIKSIIPFALQLGAGYSLHTNGDFVNVYDKLGQLQVTS